MIKLREKNFVSGRSGNKSFEEEIDTTALEVGDKFVVIKKNPFYGTSVSPLTVSKVGARDIVTVNASGEQFRFNKKQQYSDCYSLNSESVKEARLEIKKKSLFRELENTGPGAIDKELLEALEAWRERQKEKNPNNFER